MISLEPKLSRVEAFQQVLGSRWKRHRVLKDVEKHSAETAKRLKADNLATVIPKMTEAQLAAAIARHPEFGLRQAVMDLACVERNPFVEERRRIKPVLIYAVVVGGLLWGWLRYSHLFL